MIIIYSNAVSCSMLLSYFSSLLADRVAKFIAKGLNICAAPDIQLRIIIHMNMVFRSSLFF
jgi:hypothetical protein